MLCLMITFVPVPFLTLPQPRQRSLHLCMYGSKHQGRVSSSQILGVAAREPVEGTQQRKNLRILSELYDYAHYQI